MCVSVVCGGGGGGEEIERVALDAVTISHD